MQGDEQGVRVVPEDVLAAVAVVHVRIHDGDTQGAARGMRIVVADVLHHHGFVVDIAETAVAVGHAHGVVSRRTHQGKGLVFLLLHDQTGGRDGPARRSPVRIGDHGAGGGRTEMHALHLGVGGELRTVLGDAGDVEQAFFRQLVAGVEQALLTLGMGGGDGPVEGGEEDHAQPVTGSQGISHRRPACFRQDVGAVARIGDHLAQAPRAMA